MSYIIALVVIVVAAGALLLFKEPATEPVVTTENTPIETTESEAILPEGYTPPTEQPPSLNPGEEDAAELNDESETSTDTAPETTPEAVVAPSETHIATASYLTPRRTEHDIAVTVELEGTMIVDANVTYDGGSAGTPSHTAFDGAYAADVIGQDINEIELSRTGGASLTSVAFNEAVAQIRTQI